jgi:predicted nucleic acid-binding protein
MEWWRRLAERKNKWAICPITELGMMRIYGHPDYPNGPGTPESAANILQGVKQTEGCVFWPDSVSLAELIAKSSPAAFAKVTPKQLTDLYLLALAVKQGGVLATLDTRIDASLVPGGHAALEIVG